MDVDKLNDRELLEWLHGQLDTSVLVTGQLDPVMQDAPLRITRAKATTDYTSIGIAASPAMTIGSTEATEYETIADFLRYNKPEAEDVVRKVEMLLINDFEIIASMTAVESPSAIDTARGAAEDAVTAILVSPAQPNLPDWVGSTPSAFHPPIYPIAALPRSQVFFLHPSRPVSYCVEALAAIIPQGPTSELIVKAAVSRHRLDKRLRASELELK